MARREKRVAPEIARSDQSSGLQTESKDAGSLKKLYNVRSPQHIEARLGKSATVSLKPRKRIARPSKSVIAARVEISGTRLNGD